MKRVEWWIAKVYSQIEVKKGNNPFDLWEQFKTLGQARAYVRKDGPDTPFDVVKVTYETVSSSSRR